MSYISTCRSIPVGGGAFVGTPKRARVEIAYFTLDEHENSGYATATARELVATALAADPNLVVFAKTLPKTNASTSVLRKAGFVHAGDSFDRDVGPAWLWEYADA